MRTFLNNIKKATADQLADAENGYLAQITENLRGYHLLLLGHHKKLSWIPQNRLHTFSLGPLPSASAQSHYETLPLRENSIDAAILPYTLEQCDAPLTVLKELYKTIIQEGRIFIFSHQHWHPLSWLMPLDVPEKHTSLLIYQIKHFLQLAGFEIIQTNWLYYGTVVVIEAQKQEIGLTPLKPLWKEKSLLLEKQWQPTVRKSE